MPELSAIANESAMNIVAGMPTATNTRVLAIAFRKAGSANNCV